ncbi:MAG: DMT family transporter [Usitatibacter sp.]
MTGGGKRAVWAALGAAVLFGAGTPAAKWVLGAADPWLVAGLLYLGSGLGLMVYRRASRQPRASLQRGELKWLVAAIAAGGIAGPVLLMYGLARMPASGASLLLNAEGVLTVLLAWFVFRENFDRRVALGMFLIALGATAIAWPGEAALGGALPALAVVGACLAWAIDNNLTRKVALADATFIAMSKGLAAGIVNVVLAGFVAGAAFPTPGIVGATLAIGFVSYGVSLTLFVLALRGLGTARTGAYFSIAPFAGAIIAFALLGESPTLQLLFGGSLMAAGVWLHLTEHHEHRHTHRPLVHSHEHEHDAHHRHAHSASDPGESPHVHEHAHAPMTHAHPHYPDSHHRHDHG